MEFMARQTEAGRPMPRLLLIQGSLRIGFLKMKLDFTTLMPLFLIGIGLSFAALVAFIAVGIITVLVATPLLLIGSCFVFSP